MKLDKRALRRLIKEEMSRAVEAAQQDETIEEVGGSPAASRSRNRQMADQRYEDALEYLQDLMTMGREAIVNAADTLRGGGEPDPTRGFSSRNQGMHGEAEEAMMSAAEERMADAEEAMVDGEMMAGEEVEETGCEAEEAEETMDEEDEVEEAMDEEEEAMSESTSNEGGEVHREGEELSLTNEMQGHIDNADDDAGIQHVQESFNSRRLGRLAGILED